MIFPQLIVQKKDQYLRENLKQKLRVLQFYLIHQLCPLDHVWEKFFIYRSINWIFYHSFFQNDTNVIAILSFEKKHGSYSVNPKEKTENSVKNLIQWWFFLWICCRNEPKCYFGWKWLYHQKSIPGPKNTDIFSKKGVLLFSSFYDRKN